MTHAFRPSHIKKILVTVWVHGTRGAALGPTNVHPVIKVVEERMCTVPAGLHKASDVDPKQYYQASIAAQLNAADPQRFPEQHSYIFGWSGALDDLKRKKEAGLLHSEFKNLKAHYLKTYGCEPEITIFAHSHGGNVALYLADCVGTDEQPYSIKNLILLGSPVIQTTRDFVGHPLFKNKTYSFHSHADMIQPRDPQGIDLFKKACRQAWQQKSFNPFKDIFGKQNNPRFFSQRHFPADAPVTQVSLKWRDPHTWNEQDCAPFAPMKKQAKQLFDTARKEIEKHNPEARGGLLHMDFILPSFLKQMPDTLRMLEKQELVRDPETGDVTVFVP